MSNRITLDLHHQPGSDHPRPDCYICGECGARFPSPAWLLEHADGCWCAKHAAPPISSAAREATAPPWHGRHRSEDFHDG